jgi:hypothetical protein
MSNNKQGYYKVNRQNPFRENEQIYPEENEQKISGRNKRPDPHSFLSQNETFPRYKITPSDRESSAARTLSSIKTEELLDRQDVLQIFNISLRTLQNWRAKGLLKHFKIGGKIYYRLKDVEEATHLNERPFREEKG